MSLTPAIAETRVAIATREDRIIETVRETIARDLSDEQFALFAELIRATGLNPLQNQLHAVTRWDRKTGKKRVVFITGIDGLRLIAARSGSFEGEVGPYWAGPDGTWKDVWIEKAPPAAAKVGVWRKGFREPVWGIAHYNEFVQRFEGKPTPTWSDMPALMLAKCAEAQALRKAFPAETSGLYVPEEGGAMDIIDSGTPPQGHTVTVEASPQEKQEPAQQPQPARPVAKKGGPTGFSPETVALMREILAYVKSVGYPPAVLEGLIGAQPTQRSLAAWIEQAENPLEEAKAFVQRLIEEENEQDDGLDLEETDEE